MSYKQVINKIYILILFLFSQVRSQDIFQGGRQVKFYNMHTTKVFINKKNRYLYYYIKKSHL